MQTVYSRYLAKIDQLRCYHKIQGTPTLYLKIFFFKGTFLIHVIELNNSYALLVNGKTIQ